jgi:cytochrome c551/c552
MRRDVEPRGRRMNLFHTVKQPGHARRRVRRAVPPPVARFILPGGFLLVAAGLIANDVELKFTLPPETETFKRGAGVELANAQCLVCHSADYVVIQPPLPRAFWKSSVQKMRDKYGATIPEEQIEPLADYLAANYGEGKSNETKPGPPTPAPPALRTSESSKPEGARLAAHYGCSNCHHAEVPTVGPALKAVAAKYTGKPEAFSGISQQITNGGSGKWGTVPMPPFPGLSAAELKALTEWILDQQPAK